MVPGMSIAMGALMLLVWTSVEMVSGQKPCSARRRDTSQEKEPLPCPMSKRMPRSRARRTAGLTRPLWSTRRVTGCPLKACVTRSPGRRISSACSRTGGGSPMCSITGIPAIPAAATAIHTGWAVLSSPKALRLPRTLTPTTRSGLASAQAPAALLSTKRP